MRTKLFPRAFKFALILMSLIPCSVLVMAKTATPRTTVKAHAASRTTKKKATPTTHTAVAADPPASSPAVKSALAVTNTAAPEVNSTTTSGTVGGGISSYYGKKFMDGPTSTRKIALTFDDGPSAKTTPQYLEILKREGIKATFFMLSSSVKQSPELAKRVADEGHEIGCHSATHCNLRTKSPAVVQKEVVDAAREIEQITGRKPHVFRPPYGEFNKSTQQSCAEGEMVMVIWSVDTNDWRKKATPESIDAACLRETQGGSVILMHDIHEKGIQALPRVIKELKAKGFEFVTVSDLVAESIKQQPKPGADAAARQPAAQEDAPVKVKTAKKSRTSSGRK